MVEFLVAAGADVHAFTLTDEGALSFAVRYGHAEAVAALLRAYVSPWSEGVLQVAEHRGYAEIAEMLIAARRGQAAS